MAGHFDFDQIGVLGPELNLRLDAIVPAHVRGRIAQSDLEFVEDAQDTLFDLVDRDAVNEEVARWVNERPIAAYHGSRLVEADIAAIRRDGLKPLAIEDRRERIVRALEHHKDWPAKAGLLDDALALHGKGQRAGRREGQVHLTLSRNGLLNWFNHYLTHGAEVDGHIASYLLGEEGMALLKRDGAPVVFRCIVPADVAVAAMNRYNTEPSPYPVREILTWWAYWLAKPGNAVKGISADCGIALRAPMPAAWIEGVDRLADTDIDPTD